MMKNSACLITLLLIAWLAVSTAPAQSNDNKGTSPPKSEQDQPKEGEKKPILKRAVIKSKPAPDAEGLDFVGEITLRMILRSDKTVSDIEVIKSGTKEANKRVIEAARNIEFKPATKDGQPVSQYVTIVYVFH